MKEKRGIDYVMCHGKKVRILKRGVKVNWKPKPTGIPENREIIVEAWDDSDLKIDWRKFKKKKQKRI